jgi:hypothetical protein
MVDLGPDNSLAARWLRTSPERARFCLAPRLRSRAMDWTTVATAAVTGAVGYGGAWLQSRTTVEQAREETDRLRLQHAEERLRARQGTYRDLLKSLRDYDGMMLQYNLHDDHAVIAWMEGYASYRAGVDLYGSPEVVAATEQLAAVMTRTSEIAARDPTGRSLIERHARAYSPLRDDVLEARRALIEAMRTDASALPESTGLRKASRRESAEVTSAGSCLHSRSPS